MHRESQLSGRVLLVEVERAIVQRKVLIVVQPIRMSSIYDFPVVDGNLPLDREIILTWRAEVRIVCDTYQLVQLRAIVTL
jgi:hypothetical protein